MDAAIADDGSVAVVANDGDTTTVDADDAATAAASSHDGSVANANGSDGLDVDDAAANDGRWNAAIVAHDDGNVAAWYDADAVATDDGHATARHDAGLSLAAVANAVHAAAARGLQLSTVVRR